MNAFLPKEKNRVGWYKTLQNGIGYNVFALNDYEKKQFGNNAYRITSFKYTDNDPLQWTSIVKIEGLSVSLNSLKVRFIDDVSFEQGVIKYSRPYKITEYNIC